MLHALNSIASDINALTRLKFKGLEEKARAEADLRPTALITSAAS